MGYHLTRKIQTSCAKTPSVYKSRVRGITLFSIASQQPRVCRLTNQFVAKTSQVIIVWFEVEPLFPLTILARQTLSQVENMVEATIVMKGITFPLSNSGGCMASQRHTPKRPIFVLTAQISAHLHVATKVAKKISLTAKNARAVTVRAGAQAAGFRAITDFIEELAASTIKTAEQIDVIAVGISRMASDNARNQQALDSLNKVEVKAKGAAHLMSIEHARSTADDQRQEYRDKFHQQFQRLASMLDDSAKQVRSANTISSTSKIEASQLGTFQKEFRAIANDIEAAAQEIQRQLKDAESLLRQTMKSY